MRGSEVDGEFDEGKAFIIVRLVTSLPIHSGAASSYRLDFYLWFKFNSSEISLGEVEEF